MLAECAGALGRFKKIMQYLKCIVLFIVTVCTPEMTASGNPFQMPEPTPTDSIHISLLTASPGNIIYELEGHSMLRIKYGENDYCMTWGVFDFNEKDFVYRFVKGETDYMAACLPTGLALREYQATGRRVTEQRISLSRNQALALIAAANENLKPQNQKYRYNYLFDNCATRPLALIENAFGDTLHIEYHPESRETFRSRMRYYHRNYPWYQFGIDLALGAELDRPITVKESAFAPERLLKVMSEAHIGSNPAITESTIIVPGNADGVQSAPTVWYRSPIFVCWAVLGVYVVVFIFVPQGFTTRLLISVFFFAEFLAGLLLTFLIFVSVHEATSPNWLYLWLNPLAIIPCIGIWLKKCNHLLICYHFLNFVALFTLGIIALTGIQSLNNAFIPLMLLSAILSVEYLLSQWRLKRNS